MEQYGHQDKVGTLANHNRLDQLLGTDNYTSKWCGSTHNGTGQPHYCCFDCPVLKGTEKAGADDPKADEIAALKARLASLGA
jgi:hypothetical protein